MMAVALSSSDRDVIARSVDREAAEAQADTWLALGDQDDERLVQVFEVDRCVRWIVERGLWQVALQFPDGLLRFGARVAKKMELRWKELRRQNNNDDDDEAEVQRPAILGDTSYGECCVDEVAAEHIGADGVIHFGHTCLTPTQRLPVLFVYTVLPIDLDPLRVQLGAVPAEDDKEEQQRTRTLVFYDVRFHHAFLQAQEAWSPDLPHVIPCPPVEPDTNNDRIQCGRLVPEDGVRDNDVILYCGNSTRYALLLALTFNKCRHEHYDPSTRTLSPAFPNLNRELMKRFYLIEKAKDADRVGILVGTLGVSRYQDIIERVRASVRKSGKKCYTFLVGKPNVPKLANFPEIDVYVLIACPENSVVEAKAFMQPVLTPFELDVALNGAREWTGDFLANFQDLLPGKKDYKNFESPQEQADVSLITGKMREVRTEENESETVGLGRSLLQQDTTVSVVHERGGGEFLRGRSWQGLEQKLGETPVEKAVKGWPGIASGYEQEGAEQ